MTPKLSCYFSCQIGFGAAFRGRSGASPGAQRRDERNEVPGTLAGTKRPLDFFQAGLDLPLEREGIERPVLLLERNAFSLIKHAAFQQPLVRSFGRVVTLDLSRALAALFRQFHRRTEVIVIKRPDVAIQSVDRF